MVVRQFLAEEQNYKAFSQSVMHHGVGGTGNPPLRQLEGWYGPKVCLHTILRTRLIAACCVLQAEGKATRGEGVLKVKSKSRIE